MSAERNIKKKTKKTQTTQIKTKQKQKQKQKTKAKKISQKLESDEVGTKWWTRKTSPQKQWNFVEE